MNPAEFLLDIVSSDFDDGSGGAPERVQRIQKAWAESNEARAVMRLVSERMEKSGKGRTDMSPGEVARPGPLRITAVLLHRAFIKSYRDVVAYGIRIIMYLGRRIPFQGYL